MDITRDFFYGRFPVKFAKLSKIFGRCFVFEGLSYWYITRGLFPDHVTTARNPT